MKKVIFAILCLCISMFTLGAHAQQSTATLFGNVTDASGAAVPNAKVVITQTDTQTTRELVTKSDGSYRADFLPVGGYKIAVTAPGFKTLDRAGIVLTVTEEAHVDLALQVGGESTVVEVTGDVPLLNTGNSTLGRTVTNVEIDNLPLVDRNVYTLLDLTPGVQNNNAAGTGGNGGVINPLGYPEQHVKINGSSDSGVGQVAYYLDGGSNMTGVRNTGNPLPNPDAIREFRVDTSNFAAQYGRNSAGVVTVLTKSGTNQIHGSAFEFYRERNFNATIRNNSQKNPYNQHRFGFTIGGPAIHDKLFLFGSYAGFRYISVNNATPSFPSQAMFNGDFTENLPATYGTSTEPLDSAKCNTAQQSSTKFYACNPFLPKASAWCPKNVCGTAVFDPSVLAMIKAGLFPTSSTPGNYVVQVQIPFRQKTNEQLYKADYQMTQKQRLTLSYFHQFGDYIVNPSGNNVPGWTSHDYSFNEYVANVQHVWTLTNNTVNQVALNYTRLIGGRIPSPTESLKNYGSKFDEQTTTGQICGVPAQAGCTRPQLAVSGWFTAGNQITGPTTGSNVYAIRDLVSSTHGRHTLYFGGEGNRENDAQQTTLNSYGVFAFNTVTPSGTPATIAANRVANAFNAFVFGSPNTMGQDVPVYANANYFNYGAFFQDDWRILPNLTVNLGIRWDVQTTPTNTQNMTMQFVPGAVSQVVTNSAYIKGTLFPGDPGVPRSGVPNRYDHVSPRIGFAWTPYPDGKTVVHGAAGIFYGSVGGNLFNYPSNGEPFSGRPSFSNVIHLNDPYATDPKDFCNADPVCIAGGVGRSPFPFVYDAKNPQYFVKPAAIIPVDPNFHWPVIYQINFGIQQQLTPTFAFSATYVGSLGRKLPTEWDTNYPVYNLNAAGASGVSCTDTTLPCAYTNTTGNLNARRPYNSAAYKATSTSSAANPVLSTISQIQSSESSSYHSLQATASKRMSNSWSVNGFVVWSKSLQSLDLDAAGNTGNSAGTEPEDNNFHYLDKERSDYDQRWTSAISAVFKPKYGFHSRIARLVINDWTVTSIIRIQSGNPFNVTTGSDNNQDGVTNDRPNMMPGAQPHLRDNGRSRTQMLAHWIDPSQFCNSTGTTLVTSTSTNAACPQQGAGPAGVDGTVRQNTFDGPGRRSVDMSLFRDFHVYDRVTFQLRGESTNVFNLTNLPAPVSTLTSSTFGQITGSIAGGSFGNRIIQVGGRILF